MPVQAQSHARSHALLLVQKLLNLRDSASPLTLVLDSLEQSAKPVILEFLGRAKVAKSKTIFISYATLRRPADVDVFVKARGKSPESLRAEVASHYPSGAPGHAHKVLLIIDTLNPLAASAPAALPALLSALVTPAVSLVGVYHADIPLTAPAPPASSNARRSGSSGSGSGSGDGYYYHYYDAYTYAPHPLAVLSHLATAVLRVGSLHHAVERRRARGRSRPEPGFGLGGEGREGVLVGLGQRQGQGPGPGRGRGGSLVLEVELRRRSGRAVAETFVLTPRSSAAGGGAGTATGAWAGPGQLSLLAEHVAFRGEGAEGGEDGQGGKVDGGQGGQGEGEEAAAALTTFDLGLTEKQRRDREGVVLPYFDAQHDVGAGEGGRILYEMGREDDFDDEEDEI
ncbi:histone acetylation protein 2 [Xylariaceae sp. FL0804]|nr:histone acetylation protein 2 [Xylariaceae sp. FL0804]